MNDRLARQLVDELKLIRKELEKQTTILKTNAK